MLLSSFNSHAHCAPHCCGLKQSCGAVRTGGACRHLHSYELTGVKHPVYKWRHLLQAHRQGGPNGSAVPGPQRGWGPELSREGPEVVIERRRWSGDQSFLAAWRSSDLHLKIKCNVSCTYLGSFSLTSGRVRLKMRGRRRQREVMLLDFLSCQCELQIQCFASFCSEKHFKHQIYQLGKFHTNWNELKVFTAPNKTSLMHPKRIVHF